VNIPNSPLWEVTIDSHHGRDCFPAGFDTSNLRRISGMADLWNKYISTATGEVIDCADFAEQMKRDLSSNL
jgi:hypothetical protein